MKKSMTVYHYRVPETADVALAGAAPDGKLWPFSRRIGFFNSSLRHVAPHVRGGATDIRVETENGDEYKGEAVCSMSENFDYAEGRRVAALRTIHSVLVDAGICEADAEALLDMVNTGERINY